MEENKFDEDVLDTCKWLIDHMVEQDWDSDDVCDDLRGYCNSFQRHVEEEYLKIPDELLLNYINQKMIETNWAERYPDLDFTAVDFLGELGTGIDRLEEYRDDEKCDDCGEYLDEDCECELNNLS